MNGQWKVYSGIVVCPDCQHLEKTAGKVPMNVANKARCKYCGRTKKSL